MPKSYGYCRVSTDAQRLDRGGVSIEWQRARAKEYHVFKLKDTHAWGGCFVDEAISGGTPVADRPAGKKLLEAIERGDAIIVPKIDRMYRNAADFLNTFSIIETRGVQFHIVDLGIDTSTAWGKAIATIMCVFAELERRMINDRQREALDYRKQHGLQVNGHAGYGFTWKGPPRKKKRVPDHRELEIMGWIVALKKDGYIFEEIYWHLRKKEIFTRKGVEWSLSRIKNAHKAAVRMHEQKAAQEKEDATHE